MPPAKSQLGRQWLDSCAGYKLSIPGINRDTTVIFITEEPLRFDIVADRVLFQIDRVFMRRTPTCIKKLPEDALTLSQLRSFKWAPRLQEEGIQDSVFFITKKFNYSKAPRNLPPAVRNELLKSEPWIRPGHLLANGARCAGCNQIVRFERIYSLLEWVAHRDICQGIEYKMIHAVFADWADATEEEEEDIEDVVPIGGLRWGRMQDFDYPLRFVRVPSGMDVENDEDSDDEYLDDLFEVMSTDDEDWGLDLELKAAGADVKGALDELGAELKALEMDVPHDFERATQEEAIYGVQDTPDCNDSSDEEYSSSEEVCDDDLDGPPEADSSAYAFHSKLLDEHEEDAPPRWQSDAAYHPGYYDDDDDSDYEEIDEETVGSISYEEYMKSQSEKVHDPCISFLD